MTLSVFLVSLEADEARRSALCRSAPELFADAVCVKAIDGRKLDAKHYYSKITGEFIRCGRLMSPAELGCTLSHIRALELFLESNTEKALIIEDDLIATDSDYAEVKRYVQYMSEHSLYICGGQDGLNSQKYLYGKALNNEKTLFKLSAFSKRYVLRTCCYVVTRSVARHILAIHEDGPTIADNWGRICGSEINVLFSTSFCHPLDMNLSHIESERHLRKKLSFWQKALRFESYYNLFLRVQKVFVLLLFKISHLNKAR